MTTYTVFHRSEASLAEGLYVDNAGSQVFWVDINKSKIYRKSFDGHFFCRYFIDSNPSALISLKGSKLALCNSKGLVEFDIVTGDTVLISETPETGKNENFRSNDGVALTDTNVIYGTMEKRPTGATGGLYFYDGISTCSLNFPIGIPNGFIRLSDSDLLIADSYTKRVNLYKIDSKGANFYFERCWCDFSSEKFSPDGGCTDENSNVYIALWDGSGVAMLNHAGKLLRVLELPVPRPTNCKVAGNGKLYVTSARDGLSVEQLQQHPLSGSIFEIVLT